MYELITITSYKIELTAILICLSNMFLNYVFLVK